jgi:hypothetical protein
MTGLTRRRLGAVLVFTAACCGIAGCGSKEESSTENTSAPRGSQGTTASAAVENAIDACSLLSVDDVSTLLGTSVEGKPTGTDPSLAGCIWENPTSYESVSVEIGAPNTAANNTLPPPEPGFPEVGTPGPDGMRFLGNGLVEFAAAGRSNTVQVAVLSMSADAANAAAVELANKVGPQLSQ